MQTGGINGSVSGVKRRISISFSKAKTQFCLSIHYHGDEGYLYVNKTDLKISNEGNKLV